MIGPMPAPAAQDASAHTRTLRQLAPVLIVLAIIYAYSNALQGPFVFDDEISIPLNPNIRTLWPIWVPMFPAGNLGIAGRPLVSISYAINFAIDGLNPRGYHAGNIVLHALSALVLYGLIRRAMKRVGYAHADGIALCTALIWAVHPLLTDTVTYIINRTEGLACLFMLLTLCAFERSIDSHRPRAWHAAAILASLAGVASKEMAAMIGPIVLMYDGLIVSRSWKDVWTNRKWFYPFFLLDWVLVAALLNTVIGAAKLGGVGRITPWRYLLMQSQVILMYLKLCFWPTPLVISYVDWKAPESLLQVWPEMLIVGALVGLTIFLAIRRNSLAFMGAVVFLTLAPTSSILPLPSEPAAERRMYLPLAGVVLVVIVLLERLTRPLPRRAMVGAVLLLLAIVGLSEITLNRNAVYSDPTSLWVDTLANRPENPVAQYSLGTTLAKQGFLQDALLRFDSAIKIAPGYMEPRISRGQMLSKMGRNDEAMAELKPYLQIAPEDPYLLTVYAAALYNSGSRAAAQRIWQHVVGKNPFYNEAGRLLEESKRDTSLPPR